MKKNIIAAMMCIQNEYFVDTEHLEEAVYALFE